MSSSSIPIGRGIFRAKKQMKLITVTMLPVVGTTTTTTNTSCSCYSCCGPKRQPLITWMTMIILITIIIHHCDYCHYYYYSTCDCSYNYLRHIDHGSYRPLLDNAPMIMMVLGLSSSSSSFNYRYKNRNYQNQQRQRRRRSQNILLQNSSPSCIPSVYKHHLQQLWYNNNDNVHQYSSCSGSGSGSGSGSSSRISSRSFMLQHQGNDDDEWDTPEDVTDLTNNIFSNNSIAATIDTENIDVIIVGSGLAGLCAGAILNTIYHKKVALFESHSIPGGCAHAFTRQIPISVGTTRNDNNDDNNISPSPSPTTTTTTTTTTTNTTTTTAKTKFTFDSGPSILLGCSTTSSIPNALQQVLQLCGQNVSWIPYNGWNMIERITTTNHTSNINNNSASSLNNNSNNNNNNTTTTKEWSVILGPTNFRNGPVYEFGGSEAVVEFDHLRNITQSLTVGVTIPAISMRSGSTTIVPLVLKHFTTLLSLIQQNELVTGTFAPYMNGPIYVVKSKWLRNWLDALAFSLSGLPASRTAAAAMAFVLNDMHSTSATLDYPKGGMGEIVQALIRAVEQGPYGSRVYVNQHVDSIDGNDDGSAIVGVTLRKKKLKVLARKGVICNAPVWSLRNLIHDNKLRMKLNMGLPILYPQPKPPVSWTTTSQGSSINLVRDPNLLPSSSDGLLSKVETLEMTASFLHLHIAIDSTGLDKSKLAPHYTVMDRSLCGDASIIVNDVVDGPCSIGNMIAVSNPCVLDRSLAPDGYMILHAYGAGNEPYELWEQYQRNTKEYQQYKEERAQPLWRAMECIIPDVRERVIVQMIGTPLTHERFLRRPRGTYGSVTEDYLRDCCTPISNLMLASDSIFPGIGVPAVAIVGTNAANSLMNVFEHMLTLNRLEREGKLNYYE